MKDSVDFLLVPGIALRDAIKWREFYNGLEQKRSSPSKGVACDVVLSINSPDGTYLTTLFAKCWATAEWYEIVVLWAEPHGRGLYFSTYPPTLRIRSDHLEFKVEHDLLPSLTQSFERPIGVQNVFTNMFGDYPIANIRFSDESPIGLALARIGPSREPQLLDGSRVYELSDLTQGTSAPCVVVSAVEGLLRELKFFKDPDHLSRVVDFEFEPKEPKRLHRQRTYFPQSMTKAGVSNGGMTVTYRGKTSKVDAIPIVTDADGKWRILDYTNVELETFTCNLPTKIEDKSGSQVVHRSAIFLNLEEFDPSVARFSEAMRFAAFSSMDMRYRDVLVRNWKRKREDITSEDLAKIIELQEHYAELPAETFVGERMKRLNVQMELSRLEENMPRLCSQYRQFLILLSDSLDPDAALLSGYNQIDVLVLWRRFAEASDLFRLWTNWIAQNCPPEALKRFVQREMRKRNCWPIYMLMESSESGGQLGELNNFESAAVRAIAMSGVKELIEFPQRFRQDECKMAYRDWILTMTTLERANERLNDLLCEALCYSQSLTQAEVNMESQQLRSSLQIIATAQ